MVDSSSCLANREIGIGGFQKAGFRLFGKDLLNQHLTQPDMGFGVAGFDLNGLPNGLGSGIELRKI